VNECLFCNIALGRIPADVVYQDGDVVAFRDIQPQAPVHVLVVPRQHFSGFQAAGEEDEALIGKVARAAARVAEQEGIAESGFRCVVNAGPDAQQSVHHLHMHVLGGRQMSWPPG
jgi:histidine triad (HIT) family protein